MAQQSRTREPAFACFAIAILYFVSGTALETDPIRQVCHRIHPSFGHLSFNQALVLQTTGDYFLYETDAGRGNIGASLDQSDDGSIAWGYANLGAISTECGRVLPRAILAHQKHTQPSSAPSFQDV